MRLGLVHTYATELPWAGESWAIDPASSPRMVFWNGDLARDLGLDPDADLDGLARGFGGREPFEDARAFAQVYAGHQFGQFSSRLGDGRAVLLGERLGSDGLLRDLSLKGSGRTPFARGGDGKAALGPMLREVVWGESLKALGIPTTRALAVVATGDEVYRETVLPGAILVRVAESHLRIGTLEYFAQRGEPDRVAALVDHGIWRHDRDLADLPDRRWSFLERVALRQADLVAAWMAIGFVHGVQNTDNVALSGESIDFGPCALLESYDPGAVFSSIDHQGRYAYGRQPSIGRWNLARLCEAVIPILGVPLEQVVEQCNDLLDRFERRCQDQIRARRLDKLGLGGAQPAVAGEADAILAEWMDLLASSRADHTLAFRSLSAAAAGDQTPVREVVDHGGLEAWLGRWSQFRSLLTHRASPEAMDRINPLYLPRNHLVEEALQAAMLGDLQPFQALLAVVRHPWEALDGRDRWAKPASPAFCRAFKTTCGT